MNDFIDNDSNNIRPASAPVQDAHTRTTNLPITASTPSLLSVSTHRLPVLMPRPHPHQPIRALDADAFANLHLEHLTSDVPDSVLFPFLHGLEGDNVHQNSFFAASSGLNFKVSAPSRSQEGSGEDEPASEGNGSGSGGARWGNGNGSGNGSGCAGQQRAHAPNVVKVPEYRGLVWVACDDEQDEQDDHVYDARYAFDPHAHGFAQPAAAHDGEFEDEDFDFEYEDEDYEDASDEQDGDADGDEEDDDDNLEDEREHAGELMQLDVDVVHHSHSQQHQPHNMHSDAGKGGGVDGKKEGEEEVENNQDPNAGAHMHPQALRKPTASAPITIQTGPHFVHNHSSHHYASSHHHHDVPYTHVQHQHSTINFPTSSSSPASLASPSDNLNGADRANGNFEYDHEGVRRLSTSSVSTTDTVSSSTSTSTSDSAHSHYGFGFGAEEGFVASASYSTTASSIADQHFKDDQDVLDTDTDTSRTTDISPIDTGITTPCTSPMTDINIDDCIPSPITLSQGDSVSAPATATPSHPPPPYTAQCSMSSVTVISTPKSAVTATTVAEPSSGSVSPVPLTPDVTGTGATPGANSDSSLSNPNMHLHSLSPSPASSSSSNEKMGLEMTAEEVKRLTVTSSFRTVDLLTIDPSDGQPMFLPPRVPDGISLRNFGIQVVSLTPILFFPHDFLVHFGGIIHALNDFACFYASCGVGLPLSC